MSRSAHFIALALIACICLSGCATKIETAAVPGCSSSARVSVPRGCYSTVFNGALEIRCDNGETTRYTCATPKQ